MSPKTTSTTKTKGTGMLSTNRQVGNHASARPTSLFQRVLAGFGVWFVIGNYVVGTAIWPSTIADPTAMHFTHLFGFIPVMVNGWHLYFHLLSGLVCLACSLNARTVAAGGLVVASVYALVGTLGLVAPGSLDGLIMTDTFGSWVHLAEAVGLSLVGIGAWRALLASGGAAAETKSQQRPEPIARTRGNDDQP